MVVRKSITGLGLAAALLVVACSDAPFIVRQAGRLVLVELFSSPE
jgi:hypothetical protein